MHTMVYIMLLGFVVNGALVMGAGWLCGQRPALWQGILGAWLGAVYTALCLWYPWVGGFHWRCLSLVLVGLLAFGHQRRGCLSFLLLALAMDGVTAGLGQGKPWYAVFSLAAVLALGFLAFGGGDGQRFVPVELQLGQQRLKLTALRDTGNLLRDPISGAPVLIVDASTACRLTGLRREQLLRPVETMRNAPLPGLRLIPYRTVGANGDMLLGMGVKGVRVGTWRGSLTVAFAPEDFDTSGRYQALTGGCI